MNSKWWLFGLRVGLGVVFIVASVSKLSAQSLFINEVLSYDLIPYALAKLYAIALPWVELFTGIALVMTIFTSTALILSLLMALSFTIANIYAMSQGIINCGSCFGQLIPLSLPTALTIDLLMVFSSIVLLLYKQKTTAISISNFLLKGLIPRTHWIKKGLVRGSGQAALITVIVLAIGLPLSLGNTTSVVYEKIDISLDQDKLILLYFYLEGCGECEMQKPIIDELEQMYNSSITFIRADYEKEARAAVDFGVTRVPTILLIGKDPDNDYTVVQDFPQITRTEILQRSFYEILGESFCKKYGPIAEFTATPTSGYVPVKVKFTDNSIAGTDKIRDFEWAWDFNNDQIIDSGLQNPTYIYEKPGTYTIGMTLKTPCGSSTIIKHDYLTITLNNGLPVDECKADFFAEFEEVNGIIPIRFFDKSVGKIVAWEWDFDNDGVTDSHEPNPTHIYFNDGVYSVKLTIRTADCEDALTRQDYITVIGCAG